MKLGHAPVIQVLSATHGVREVYLPAIAIVYIGKCRRNTTFGHYSVGFAKQRPANDGHLYAGIGRFDSSAKARTSGTDYKDIVCVCFELRRH
jgi:hypothetical protein